MFTFEEIGKILDVIIDQLPTDIVKGLNGGVLLLDEVKYNNRIPSLDYYVLGEYCHHPVMGDYINLYYGSIMALYCDASVQEMRGHLEAVINHEFRHFVERRAGVRDLEIEDEKYIEKALQRISKE